MEYYCHACTSQGRLVGGVCSRCQSEFVEEIRHDSPGTEVSTPEYNTINPIEEFMRGLFGGQRVQRAQSGRSGRSAHSGHSHFTPPSPPANSATHPASRRGYVMIGSGANPMTFSFGGQATEDRQDTENPENTQDARNLENPTLSDFLANSFQPPPIHSSTRPDSSSDNTNNNNIGGYIQNLLSSLLGSSDVPSMSFSGGEARFGDYILSQGAFDRFVDELMENQQTSSVIPASDERIARLERGLADMGWIRAQEITDCSICKEDFKVGDEWMAMPCSHAFHPQCLAGWLNINGTCPICRYSVAMERQEWDRRRENTHTHTHTHTQRPRRSSDPTTNMPGSFGGTIGPSDNVQSEDVD
ncbi:hypothetical protein E3P89_02937 [Wallemia ichthyophaga]|uniref:RING-type domain-containing protein n=1 Tax=Wallemia ichthyophaga TaxID=245174 RepID=A0A4T0H192_WALIC|nr:hypothetical protein E3P90_03549 [Wallemia ichthyophaga]TIB10184.1 hypothetical protein E3P93_02962 [Wallemia ichthyophaga]TIB20877.1 hypothetical protein E3P89_02937 [Wallemia ichthyophaga]TIB21268.1 hypothetical protein E3P88_03563 [Wallemia ichthyophaga]